MSSYLEKQKEDSFSKPFKLKVVMIHGLLGWGGDENETELIQAILGPYYNIQQQIDFSDKYEFIYPSLGKINNIHDQAVDLFFRLIGGVTDYGKENENNLFKHIKNAHKRFGINNIGSFPQWSNTNKIICVGHSFGTFICYHLQYLLRINWFHNNTNYSDSEYSLSKSELNENAISIIVGLNSCLSGSILPNLLCGTFNEKYKNESEKELIVKDSDGKMIDFFPFRFSPVRDIGYYIGVFIMITQTLSLKNRLFEFIFSYNINNYNWDVTFLDCLKLNHPIFKYDNALVNLSIRGSAEYTKNFKLCKDTLYLNFATNATWYSKFLNRYLPIFGKVFFPWWVLVYKYANDIKNTPDRIWPGNKNVSSESILLDNDLILNDALVSLLSQMAPIKWNNSNKIWEFIDSLDKLHIYNTEYIPINNSLYQCNSREELMSILELKDQLNTKLETNKKYTRKELINLVKKTIQTKNCPSKLNYMEQFEKGKLHIWVPTSDLEQLDHLSIVLMVKWRASKKLFEFWKILFRFIKIYSIDQKLITN